MDKHEFEKFKNEMAEELIKVAMGAIQTLKEELGIDDEQEGCNEAPEHGSAEEHENPEFQRGDWIVFEEILKMNAHLRKGFPYKVEMGQYGLGVTEDDGNFTYVESNGFKKGKYRFATEREIMFAEAGRDVNEFRVNDLVVDEQWGKAFVIVKVSSGDVRNDDELTGIPINGYDEHVLSKTEKVVVVCFAENRKDMTE